VVCLHIVSLKQADFPQLYQEFSAPINTLDCGMRCAPYNQGIPVCCNIQHAIPTAYLSEWEYLSANTDLWHLFQADQPGETARLQTDAGPDQVLITCQGHLHCQRDFRSLVCRAFPFFPYLDSQGDFLGLSYYWDYEDRCWVISNLDIVTDTYRQQFMETYTRLFEYFPTEQETFQEHSNVIRSIFQKRHRSIPVLHRDGGYYKISPTSEKMRRVTPQKFLKFGPYKIADFLIFPNEL